MTVAEYNKQEILRWFRFRHNCERLRELLEMRRICRKDELITVYSVDNPYDYDSRLIYLSREECELLWDEDHLEGDPDIREERMTGRELGALHQFEDF